MAEERPEAAESPRALPCLGIEHEVQPWELLGEEARGHYRVFSVKGRRMRSPRTGQEHEFYVIDCTNWVNVIPITADGRVVMVRQFRYGTQELTLEIPGGMLDPDEQPLQAGARELLEETGFASDDWLPLGHVHPNPAIQSNQCYTYLARNARCVQPPAPEGTEEIDVVLVPREELAQLVATGVIRHSLVVVAIYALELYERGLLHPSP